MNITRRDLGVLLPVLASGANAQQTAAQPPATPKPGVLPSKVYHNEQIPYKEDGAKKGRRIFIGTTHTAFNLEMHETILPPGQESHPPHKHVNEETIVIVDGTIDVFIEGKTETATAGSVTFFASNELHNFRNAGKTPARYYVLELRGDAA